MRSKSILLAVLVLFLVSNSSFAVTASFQGLGDLPGGYTETIARDVSADGSAVVGTSWSSSGCEAFRWTQETGIVGLGSLPDHGSTEAYGVSYDGSVIVGSIRNSEGREKAFRWTRGSGMVRLKDEDYLYSRAYCVSGDGSVVGGETLIYWSVFSTEACRWTNDEAPIGLGYFNWCDSWSGLYFYSEVRDMSNDGSILVGESTYNYPGCNCCITAAFIWTAEDGMVNLGDLLGGSFKGAHGVSGDGSFVVGVSDNLQRNGEAFLWSSESGAIGLASLLGEEGGSVAYDVSIDGSIVVGKSASASGGEAFIWDAENGMRSLRDVLVNDCGLDLTDWILRDAMGISDDGLTIFGNGINPNGDKEGWIATIPEPASILLVGLGGIILRKKR